MLRPGFKIIFFACLVALFFSGPVLASFHSPDFKFSSIRSVPGGSILSLVYLQSVPVNGYQAEIIVSGNGQSANISLDRQTSKDISVFLPITAEKLSSYVIDARLLSPTKILSPLPLSEENNFVISAAQNITAISADVPVEVALKIRPLDLFGDLVDTATRKSFSWSRKGIGANETKFVAQYSGLEPEHEYRGSFTAKDINGRPYYSGNFVFRTPRPKVNVIKIEADKYGAKIFGRISDFGQKTAKAWFAYGAQKSVLEFDKLGNPQSNNCLKWPFDTGIFEAKNLPKDNEFNFQINNLYPNSQYYVAGVGQSGGIGPFCEVVRDFKNDIIILPGIIFKTKPEKPSITFKNLQTIAQTAAIYSSVLVNPFNSSWQCWFRLYERKLDPKTQKYSSIFVIETFRQNKGKDDKSCEAKFGGNDLEIKPGTKYIVESYASSTDGGVTKLSREITVDKMLYPKVEVLPATFKQGQYALVSGNIKSFGGAASAYVGFKIWEASAKEPDISKINLADFVKQKLNDGKLIKISRLQKFDYFANNLKPSTRYKYRALAINNFLQESSNIEEFETLSGDNYLSMTHFAQGDPRWAWCSISPQGGGSMALKGCGDTSLAMMVRYWYENNERVKSNWDYIWENTLKKNKNLQTWYKDHNLDLDDPAPNPYSLLKFTQIREGVDEWTINWDKAKLISELKEIGLGVRELKINDPAQLKAQYFDKGIPLISFCRPSFVNGCNDSQHYIVLSGYDKNQKEMFIEDPAEKEKSPTMLTTRYYGSGGGPCFCGSRPWFESKYFEGNVAIVPCDLKDSQFKYFFSDISKCQ